ncbi:MAG TPA: MFS transporter [Pseudonocardiaceae bacterium]|nr:MFS transporter [Pseudonocardiaceae bacterium]
MIESAQCRASDEIHDLYGRRYRIGTSDRALLGHSRTWVLTAAWLAMAAVSANQYAYGALAPRMAALNGWGSTQVLWGFALWGACHAAAAGGYVLLRGRARFAPRQLIAMGAILCASGLAMLGNIGGPALALVGYGVLNGVGTGLVYRGCLITVAGWYPDRPVCVAAVSAAFGYGAIPLVLLASAVPDLPVAVDQTAFVSLAVVLACAALLAEAPAHWWPTHLDPHRWAVDRRLNPALRHERPAVRQHSTAEVLRAPVTAVMCAVAVCVSSVALFDTACLVLFGRAAGWPPLVAAAGLAVFAAGSGAVRPVAVLVAGRIGRHRVVRLALGAGAVAQVALLGGHRSVVVLLVAAFVAGAAIGVWYALFPGLVRSSYGERPGLPNLWLLYPAKAVGAVLGVGGGAALVAGGAGYPLAIGLSALLLLTGAGLIRLLRQPGRPRTLPTVTVPAPRSATWAG